MTLINSVETTPQLVSAVYKKSRENISYYKKNIKNVCLTLSEKILIGHLFDIENDDQNKKLERGKSYALLRPDRVALQDVTGQMTLLQFMQSGLKRTVLPTTVHCDHLIQARLEGVSDTKAALYENNEVFKFLESASRKYGVGFWKPGAGIIHQVVLENYAFPGGLMIGTDSHTPNAGGLGMIHCRGWWFRCCRNYGRYAMGNFISKTNRSLSYRKVKWMDELPKISFCTVATKLTVSGGTNAIIEYFGPGSQSISCTGKATITNMGAEIGATCSVFEYDKRMETYLQSTNRTDIAEIANQNLDILTQDREVNDNPEKYFDRIN